MHLRLEVGRWWFQVGLHPKTDAQDEHPMIVDHPTPQVVYHPERVGFYKLGDEADTLTQPDPTL